MLTESKQKPALEALNKVLVHTRTLAHQRASHELLAKALDTAELLPMLIARESPNDLSADFKAQLEHLVALDAGFGVALQHFCSD